MKKKLVKLVLVRCSIRLPGLEDGEGLEVPLPETGISLVEAETVKEFIVYLNSMIVTDNGKFSEVFDRKNIGIDFGPTIMRLELNGDLNLVKKCYDQLLNLKNRRPIKV